MKQEDLHNCLANYDVGLALEITKVDLNKDIAVSNKIYAYAQAGLYILATDTRGQGWFIETYPFTGELTGQQVADMTGSISRLIRNKADIRNDKIARFNKSKILSWENSGSKLLNLWK